MQVLKKLILQIMEELMQSDDHFSSFLRKPDAIKNIIMFCMNITWHQTWHYLPILAEEDLWDRGAPNAYLSLQRCIESAGD